MSINNYISIPELSVETIFTIPYIDGYKNMKKALTGLRQADEREPTTAPTFLSLRERVSHAVAGFFLLIPLINMITYVALRAFAHFTRIDPAAVLAATAALTDEPYASPTSGPSGSQYHYAATLPHVSPPPSPRGNNSAPAATALAAPPSDAGTLSSDVDSPPGPPTPHHMRSSPTLVPGSNATMIDHHHPRSTTDSATSSTPAAETGSQALTESAAPPYRDDFLDHLPLTEPENNLRDALSLIDDSPNIGTMSDGRAVVALRQPPVPNSDNSMPAAAAAAVPLSPPPPRPMQLVVPQRLLPTPPPPTDTPPSTPHGNGSPPTSTAQSTKRT